MFRRIALPALLLVFGAAGAVAQNPQPQPAPAPTPTPTPTNPPSDPYPQASPQQDKSPVSQADSQQIQQGKAFARQRLTTLLEGITLTNWQRAKIDTVMQRYEPDFPAGSPENATDSALIQRWTILLPRLDNEVRMVLTDAQQPTWDRNVEQMRQRRRVVGDR